MYSKQLYCYYYLMQFCFALPQIWRKECSQRSIGERELNFETHRYILSRINRYEISLSSRQVNSSQTNWKMQSEINEVRKKLMEDEGSWHIELWIEVSSKFLKYFFCSPFFWKFTYRGVIYFHAVLN